ncbi:L-threonylcarbamoyladenylate synthase [Croceiramulus getboli]|nr:L-threonylcarbamoyladenylate synthase [Flavobacteriaceae bacterium YJPT1-3]
MDEQLSQAYTVLKQGGIIVYPTDTIWGIGCDATNAEAVSKIYALKQRAENKAMICLVSDFKMLNQYVQDIPEVAYDILKYARKPTTIIYDKPRHVAENLVAEDDTLAVRVTKDRFCERLIRKLKGPLVSTSANISGQPAPKSYKEIDPAILEGVDYIVNLPDKKKPAKPSAIIKLSSQGEVQVLRT